MKYDTLKLLLAICATIVFGSPALAVPGLISYQGQLTDPSGNPITTPVVVTFTFHDVPTGGSPLASFSDTDTVTPDANGIYATFVGDEGDPIPASIFDGDEVWLNVNVGGEDLAPRIRVTSSGYAIRAATADFATTASLATSANFATTAGSATTADFAMSAGFADDATTLQGLAPSAFLNMAGDSHVVVQTTTSATQNAVNLLAAYDAAKLLTPNGGALADDNRAVVLVAPGNYDLGAGVILLDADFVDLVGLSSARDNQRIFSTETVLVQTAGNVRIENLVFSYTGANPATPVYFPHATWDSGKRTGSAPENDDQELRVQRARRHHAPRGRVRGHLRGRPRRRLFLRR